MKLRVFGWLVALGLLGGAGCVGGSGDREAAPSEVSPLRLSRTNPYAVPAGPGARAEPAPATESRPAEDVATVGLAGDRNLYTFKLGDQMVVYLRGIPQEQQLEMLVDDNGLVKLPLIEPIAAAGLTTTALENRIQDAYIRGAIYRAVTVNIVVPSQVSTKSYFVRGEVRSPGRYALTSGVTLLQAIAAAGGYTDFASTRSVTLMRGGRKQDVNVRSMEKDPSTDLRLEDGDVVIIPRSIW